MFGFWVLVCYLVCDQIYIPKSCPAFPFFGNFIFELDPVLQLAGGQVLVPLALVYGVVALSKSSWGNLPLQAGVDSQ